MYSWWRRFVIVKQRLRGQAMAETAITIPAVMLLVVFMVNGAMAGFAAVNAANAANYGARVGSVTQRGAVGAAVAAAQQSIANAPLGEYQVSAYGGGPPGSQVVVVVTWRVPNLLAPVLSFFGGGNIEFSGQATATFRQEGW